MISIEDKKKLDELKASQPDVYQLIQKIQSDYLNTISKASHDIKNIISTMGSSFQFIETKHPEAGDFRFWKELGHSIDFLIEFMEQTSIYRYSHTIQKASMNIEELLYSIPDYLDDIYENEIRNFESSIDEHITTVNADFEKIKLAMIQLVRNSYEATISNDTITIEAAISPDSKYIILSVKDCGSGIDNDVIDEVIKPFYSTKDNHTGVGLSIAHTVVVTHDGFLSISSDTNQTVVSLHIPSKI